MGTGQPTVRDNFAVNGNAGAFTNITSTVMARKMTVTEDPINGQGQGLQWQTSEDGYATTHYAGVGEIITVGNPVAHLGGRGKIIGFPQQPSVSAVSTDFNFIAASIPLKIRSATATATKIRITEEP